MCLSSYNLTNNLNFWELAFSSEGGSQIYKKSASINSTPLFRQQKFYDPHCRYTLPPKQAKIVFISLFEQNKHTICGHLVTPYNIMILVIKNSMTPLFFFPRIYDPPVYLGPPSKENASPLYHIQHVFSSLFLFFSVWGHY